MTNESPTLKVGKYSIEMKDGGFGIFAVGEFDNKEWVATAPDPESAMKIVEGLIMVEMKRFYHPEATPIVTGAKGKPLPPFLKKGTEAPKDDL
jgi:hypothetical protein